MPVHVLDPFVDNLRREFDSACQQSAAQARSQQLQALNQLFRRFRSYQTEGDWIHTLLDAASQYTEYVAVFSIASETLRLRGQIPLAIISDNLSFPLRSAAAFGSAIQSKDPVTTLRRASEVGPLLSQHHPDQRAHIFPITNGDRVSAILFAADNGSDMNALELISGIASSVLERKANSALHAQITAAAKLRKTLPASLIGALEPIIAKPEPFRFENPQISESSSNGERAPSNMSEARHQPFIDIAPLHAAIVTTPAAASFKAGSAAPAALPAEESRLPAWSDLPTEQRQLHIRAQRFARVTVAEIQISRQEACRAGREQSDLYLFLKREIDKARENYRKQFMTVPSMVDYLHLELIQNAAHGDEHKLGVDYPGRLL